MFDKLIGKPNVLLNPVLSRMNNFAVVASWLYGGMLAVINDGDEDDEPICEFKLDDNGSLLRIKLLFVGGMGGLVLAFINVFFS